MRVRLLAPLRGLVYWDGQGGCDHEFAQKIIRFPGTMAEAERDILATFKAREQAIVMQYVRFVERHASSAAQAGPLDNFVQARGPQQTTLWPGWRFFRYSYSLLIATDNNIRSTLINYHRIYRPWLIGDLVRRSPGRCLTTDATFELLGATDTEGEALVFWLGATRAICSFFVLDSESWAELEAGGAEFCRRLTRLGTLQELAAVWDDRCCNGAADVRKHPVVTIFHGSRISRAPFKDLFHRWCAPDA